MTNIEIIQIASYIKDLEEGLYEWDYDNISMQTEYSKLYETIKTLMDATFKSKDKKEKVLLASLELKARKCKDCIERRTAVRN